MSQLLTYLCKALDYHGKTGKRASDETFLSIINTGLAQFWLLTILSNRLRLRSGAETFHPR